MGTEKKNRRGKDESGRRLLSRAAVSDSASRSSFFSHRLMTLVRRYEGTVEHVESVTVATPADARSPVFSKMAALILAAIAGPSPKSAWLISIWQYGQSCFIEGSTTCYSTANPIDLAIIAVLALSFVTMAQMEKGKTCGACHNGKRSFAVTANCDRCHKG